MNIGQKLQIQDYYNFYKDLYEKSKGTRHEDFFLTKMQTYKALLK